MLKQINKGFLTGNILKLIAMLLMTVDHVCKQYEITNMWLLALGRLAMPIFAYMIAEGCKYTKNRIKYFSVMFVTGVLCQVVYYFTLKSLYQCILITFSMSLLLIYAVDLIKRKKLLGGTLTALMIGITYVACNILPKHLEHLEFEIDYGFFGVLLPVLIFLGKTKLQKLIMLAIGLVLMAYALGEPLQWYSLSVVPLIFFYNGKRGKVNLKYLFYVYYPLHLGAIYLLYEGGVGK